MLNISAISSKTLLNMSICTSSMLIGHIQIFGGVGWGSVEGVLIADITTEPSGEIVRRVHRWPGFHGWGSI